MKNKEATPAADSAPIYGKNAVESLLKSGTRVDTLFLAANMDERAARYYTALARDAGAIVKRSPAEKLAVLANSGAHQGVVAFAAPIAYCNVEDMLQLAAARGEDPFILLLDGVQDPHNLGALLRSALLCGAHGAVIPKRGGAAVTPAAVKASAGAATQLLVARVANIGETVRNLKKQNVFVYAAGLAGPSPDSVDLTGPVALVMGAEDKGVSPLVAKLCDGALSLPMAPGVCVDSFNVSVAGGILMHEIFRQHRKKRALRAADGSVGAAPL